MNDTLSDGLRKHEEKYGGAQLGMVFKDSLEDKAMRFHKENPQVYELFKEYTFQVVAKGYKNYGAHSIFERIRWHTSIETKCDLGFKINDHHYPYYARMFMKEFPRYKGFFRTRKLKDES